MSTTAVSLLLAFLFSLCGILFSRGKGTHLLSAFVMLTPQERSKMDLPKLCKKLAPILFIYAIGFVLMAIFSQLNMTSLYVVALIVFFYGIGRTMSILRKAKEDILD